MDYILWTSFLLIVKIYMNDFSNKVVHFIVSVLVSTDQLTDRLGFGQLSKANCYTDQLANRPVVIGLCRLMKIFHSHRKTMLMISW